MPAAEVQAVLRRVFRRWGRPRRLRLDNGIPWGAMVDLPSELTLWLLGLDIDITFNPPRRPQDNGVIERSQGTGKRWAEPGACANAKELQRRLKDMDVIQREETTPCGDLCIARSCDALGRISQSETTPDHFSATSVSPPKEADHV